jgi:hypothetical protein
MIGLRDRYFRTLGFDPRGASARPRLEAALARAYQQRSFEIEHYWKRATYFWGFQVAIFAALGLLWKALPINEGNPVTFALTGLGILTALASSLSARGSKFWQENWEHHIDMLEDAIEGRLHKIVWLRGGNVSFSVSGVNQALSDCLVVFWIMVATYVAWAFLGPPSVGWPGCVGSARAYVLVGTFMIVGAIWLCSKRTTLRGTVPKDDGSRGDSPWKSPYWFKSSIVAFIRRDAPDEG